MYRLVEGITTADEVTKSVRPKLIGCTILSILYDLPRAYLNVNLFGSLCSFYYNVVMNVNNHVSFRYKTGTTVLLCLQRLRMIIMIISINDTLHLIFPPIGKTFQEFWRSLSE